MAAPSLPLTRLAYRPLSSRIQCRFASGDVKPGVTAQPNKASSLASELLKSIEKNRRAPRTGLRLPGRGEPRGTLRSIEEARPRSEAPQRLGPTRTELEKMAARRWVVGDVYAPHDLSGIEQKKWRTPKPAPKGTTDVFDQLGINPLREYKNFALMAEFVSETGRIKHRNETGLRPVNQRRIAKAIKRAIGCGLMPRTYKHPELLKRDRYVLRRASLNRQTPTR